MGKVQFGLSINDCVNLINLLSSLLISSKLSNLGQIH